jgi:hypothetical protein
MRAGDSVLRAKCFIAVAAFLALQGFILFAMGRPLICTCGIVKLWEGSAFGPENSQHLLDWYTSTHLIHGVGLYALLWLIMPRAPIMLRFLVAVAFEVTWEILENTPIIIDRYRQTALAQGYVGDSIINSISDTLAAACGFATAKALPVWSSVVLVIVTELFLGYMIHDNLTLNIIHLIRPG